MFQLSEDRKKLIRLNGYQHSYIEVPWGVEEICEEAFIGRHALKIIKLPSTLKKIGERAFKNCSSLKRIEIPNKVDEIGTGAFSNCNNLRIAILPSNLTTLWSNIFSGCSTLQYISINNQLENLTVSSFAAINSDCTFIVPTEHLDYYQDIIVQLKEQSITMQHKHFTISDDKTLVYRTWEECVEEWNALKRFYITSENPKHSMIRSSLENGSIPFKIPPFGIKLSAFEYSKFKNERRDLREIEGWCASGRNIYNHLVTDSKLKKELSSNAKIPRRGFYKLVQIVNPYTSNCTLLCYFNFENSDEFVEEIIEIEGKRIDLMNLQIGKIFQVSKACLRTYNDRTFYDIESVYVE